MIEEEIEAKWVDDSTKMAKGDTAQDQRVLEAPRAKGNKESIVEMIRQMDRQFDKTYGKFQASMAAIDMKVAQAA